jgi:tetratricopeptide (TPR) repeat protein
MEDGSRSGYVEAGIHFREAISQDPDFALAYAMLGRSLFPPRAGPERYTEEAVKEAGTHILRALELDDALSEAYSVQGLQREGERDYDAAEESYNKAIELDPNNAEAYQSYAAFLRRRDGRTEEVATLYQKAYDLDPKHEFAQDRLSLSFSALGQWEEALKARLQWVAEKPESFDAHRHLGRIYDKILGRWDDAVVAYRQALSLEQGLVPLFTRFREAYAGLGDTKKAIEWIDRGLEVNQRPLSRAQSKCYKFNLTEDEKSREESALEGLKEYPGNGELLGHLTDLYIASGQADEVRTRWEQAYPALFDLSPEVNGTNATYAKDVARVLMATDEREQADRLIAGALAVVTSQVPTWEILSLEASLHAVAGDDSKVLDAIRRCLEAGGSPYDLMMQDELKHFESNTEYQAMAEKRREELAIQLERIQEKEANGELAPKPEVPAN